MGQKGKVIVNEIISLKHVLHRKICKLIAVYVILNSRNTNTVKLNRELQFLNTYLRETIIQYYKHYDIFGKGDKTLTNINNVILSKYFDGNEGVIEKVDNEFLQSELSKIEKIIIDANKLYNFFLFDLQDIYPPNPKILKAVDIFILALNRHKKYPKLLTLVNYSQNFITRNSWKNFLNRASFRIHLLKSLDEKSKLSNSLKHLIINESHFIIINKLIQEYNFLKRKKKLLIGNEGNNLILKYKWGNSIFGKRQIVNDAKKISELINKIEFHSLKENPLAPLIEKPLINTTSLNKWSETSKNKLKLTKRKNKKVKKVFNQSAEISPKIMVIEKFNWVAEKSKLNKLFNLLTDEGFLSQSKLNLENLISKHILVNSENNILDKNDNFEPIRWEKRLIDLVYLIIKLYDKEFLDYKQKGKEPILILNHFVTKNGTPLKLSSIRQTKIDLLNNLHPGPKNKSIIDYVLNEVAG